MFGLDGVMIFIIVVCLAGYFIPTIVAHVHQNRNILGIFLLNLFAGWTLAGWVGALIWAVYKPKEESKV